MARYIASLNSRAALQEIRAGGKGASLAWLRRNGFNVPPGFLITSTALRDFLTDFGIEALAQRSTWTQRDLERIRELLLACRIPGHITDPIGKAHGKLGGPVAVRSSMVGEDTEITSFAGQLDTILNVQGDRELLNAVKACWASMFNWRLFSYLAEREAASPALALESFSIAVVVQRMVDARAAGVAFSADPLTGQRCTVIEAVHGLGDLLVRGLVEPDRYVVDARGIIAEAMPADAEAPVLADRLVLRLAEIVRDVAGRAKDPQDIEWAWDDNDFWLLQSRPVTSLVGQRVYSNRMVSDMSPGLIKPLIYSTNTLAMARNVFGRVFTGLIGPNDIDFTSMVKRIHSRIYTDMTMVGELLERVGLPGNFFETVSRDERADHLHPPLNLRTLRAMVRLLRFAWHHFRAADQIAAFVERHNRELVPYRQADWSSHVPQDLLAQANRLAHLHSETPLLVCGLWLVNRVGQKRVAGIGLVIVALAFAGIITAGGIEQRELFIGLVLLLGIGSGISASGMLSLMVDFTTPEQAGLLMGAWTIAHQLAEVVGNFLGGVLVDGVLALSGSYFAAFGTVFGLEIIAAIVGLVLLSRISVTTFVGTERHEVEKGYAPAS